MKAHSLRQRIAIVLTLFSALVAAPIIFVGTWMNERTEEAVWTAMLSAELTELDVDTPGSRLLHHGVLQAYVWRRGNATDLAQVPAEISILSPGLHDDIEIGGREWVVLVHDYDSVRAAARIDITELESEETVLSVWAVLAALTALGLLLATLSWLAGHAVAPVTLLAAQLQARTPETLDPFVTPFKEREIAAVIDALNGYVARMHDYVRRERQFVETMSHELRTPLAVILGAAEVLELSTPEESKGAAALKRIQQTTWGLSNLAQVLLFLSGRKDRPVALEDVDLGALLTRSLQLFKAEFAERRLQVSLSAATDVHAQGVRPLCDIIVNNLIRNCCDHGSGTVEIDLKATRLTISNRIIDGDGGQTPGAPSWRGNAGIGLDLIDRVCVQLGWSMKVSSEGDVFQVAISFGRAEAVQPATN